MIIIHQFAPSMNLLNNTVFASQDLYVASGATNQNKKNTGLTFEIRLKSDNSIILNKSNAPVFKSDSFVLQGDVDANNFLWSDAADGAVVGVVVPTSYEISTSSERDQFEGSEKGKGAEYSFTVTRKGNLALSQKINYEVTGTNTINADDFITQDNKIEGRNNPCSTRNY